MARPSRPGPIQAIVGEDTYLAEELWARLGERELIALASWPAHDEALCVEDTVELAVQVNGKVRGRVVVPREAGEAEIRARALAEPRVAEHVQGRQMVKLVVVPGRLVSVVVR